MQISCPKDASLAFSRWALALGRIVAAANGLHNLRVRYGPFLYTVRFLT